MGTSRDHVVLWIEMMKALLKHPTENCMRAVYDAVNDKDKLLKWKDYPAQVKEIFAILSKVTVPDWVQGEDRKKTFEYFKDFANRFLDGVNKAKLQKDIREDMVFFVFHCIELKDVPLYAVAYEVTSKLEFNGKTDKDLLMKIIHFLNRILSDETYGWLQEDLPYPNCLTQYKDWHSVSTSSRMEKHFPGRSWTTWSACVCDASRGPSCVTTTP
ncbi:uncharacterized protein LOC112554283 [Pomacea canaliculata]|uniref:uncharacterized protein LOC112554283 n=1 Tax=Pomacea canaliculata TaxID=400727 RepID=UPI000D72F24B|nr:uncharacterized protein LOC112554283 [Pomacea canaliculata]